jgi:hypothetical protein
VVLKGYFDGAKTADADRVTLASVSGTCDEWAPAERAWKQIIADHKAPPCTQPTLAAHAHTVAWRSQR